MDDNEGVIQALHEFENMTDADKVLTQELEDLFVQIAHTGRIQIPWVYLKPVFMFKMDKVMRDFFESSPSRNSNSTEPTNNAEFDVMRQRLLDCIESFASAPFTIQRLCELMVEPKRHYRCSDKFMRGIEKNVLVVSTMSESEEDQLTNNIDANHDSTCIPNGPVTNGIITTASPTEIESVDRHDSDGGHLQHFSEIHYSTPGELQTHNGSHSNDHREGNAPKEGEYTENEKVLTQNSTNKEIDCAGSKDSGVRIQGHCEKDNTLEDKTLEEKNNLKAVCEEKECDAGKEEIKENTVEQRKSIDNDDEEKKESLIIDSKENENKEEATTCTTAGDEGEPMEE